MPAESEVDEALDRIAEYAEELNHVVQIRDNPNILQAEPNNQSAELELRGHQCEYEDHLYYVGAHEDWSHAILVYYLSLQQNVSAWIDEDEAMAIIEAAGLEGDGNPRMKAARYLLDNADLEESQAFGSYFTTVAADSSHFTQVHRTDSGIFRAYSIERKILPYEDNFSIRDYNEAATAVIGAGQKSNALAISSTGIRYDEENPAESAVDFGYRDSE